MKLCSFSTNGTATYGILTGRGIVDLGRRFREATLHDFLAAGNMDLAAALADGAPDHALDAVTLDPVIPYPDKIICVGLNYHDHVP